MKSIIKLLFGATILTAAVVACQKEPIVEEPAPEGVQINVIADGSIAPDTKTAVVDGTPPSVKWLSTDQLTVYEIVDGTVATTATSNSTTLSGSDYEASFRVTLGGSPSGSSYKYVAVYPAGAVGEGGSGENKFYRLTMPNEQTLIGNNFSADSDILISTVLDHGDRRVANDEDVEFAFRRVGTAVKLTLKGITPDEKITKVVITAPQNIAGRVKFVRETSSLVADSWYYSGEGQKTITLKDLNITATGNDVLWFRVLAKEGWEIGDELSVEVETDKANYYRNGHKSDPNYAPITLTKAIGFVEGGLTAFGINLASYRVVKPVAKNYTLVENNASFVNNGKYLIVNKAGTKAMGEYVSANNSYYGLTDVASDNKVISITSEAVQVITLEEGATTGQFYMKDSDGKYLYWSSGNSINRADSKGSTNAYLWTITTEKITNVGTTTRFLQYNNSSTRFACYQESSNMADVDLYVEEGSLSPALSAPINVDAVVVDDAILVTWDDITAPTGETVTYHVTCTGETAQDIAEGDESATFTNLADGTYEISVTAVPSTSAYQASPSVTVGSLVVNTSTDPKYVKVVSAPSNWGGEYLLVCESTSLALSEFSTTSTVYGIGASVSIANSSIESNNTTNAYKVVIASATGGGTGYTIKLADKYINWSSGNSLSSANAESDNTRWTISAGETSGNWIITNVAQDTRVIWYNTNSPRFACYENKTESSGGYAPVQLYQLEDTRTDPGMSWSPASVTASWDTGNTVSGFTAPTLTAGNATSITYESTNTAVATVSNTGAIAVTGPGTATIKAIFAGDATYKAATATCTITVNDNRATVDSPTFDPAAGEIEAGTVSISCGTASATIYYTTDGNNPTTSSTVYSAPISVNAAMTIKAFAVREGYKDSAIATAEYTIAGVTKNLPYTETFASSKGDFTVDDVTGTDTWKIDSSNGYMKATSYYSSSNHAAESWLISPSIQMPSLSSGESIKLKFTQCINKYFGTVSDEATLWIKVGSGDWTKQTISYPTISSGNWSSFEEQVVDLSSYAGEKVKIAFKYVGTTTASGTWEVKNVSVKKYEPKALSSISVNGQTINFVKDGTFSFGGTVTAHYNDETTADVTGSATFTGYNMANTGEQTVTVSYTEGGITKTTTYTINVSLGGGTVVFTPSSQNAVTVTGANLGITATYSNTYNNANQMTGGNSCTLTITGLGGKKITGISINAKNNKSSGSGTLTITSGSTNIINSYTLTGLGSSYQDVSLTVVNGSVSENATVVMTINCTTNSTYFGSLSITYE